MIKLFERFWRNRTAKTPTIKTENFPGPNIADQKEISTLMREAKRRIDQPVLNDDGASDYVGLHPDPLYKGAPLDERHEKQVFRDY